MFLKRAASLCVLAERLPNPKRRPRAMPPVKGMAKVNRPTKPGSFRRSKTGGTVRVIASKRTKVAMGERSVFDAGSSQASKGRQVTIVDAHAKNTAMKATVV